MYFCHSDLLPNKDISYRSSVIQKSFRVKRTCLTFGQQTALEDVFQRKKCLSDNEKTTIAIELGVAKTEMEVIHVGFFLSRILFNSSSQNWSLQGEKSP